MSVTDKKILNRLYLVAIGMLLFAIAIAIKLVSIQFVDGEKYRELAQDQTVKEFKIKPNRGNLYASDGTLLATSVTKYDLRFDALAPSDENFEKYVKPLSDSLGVMFNKPTSYFQNVFRKARNNKNRYMLLTRNLGYTDYMRIKSFPLFNKGPYKGGIITEQETVREYPLGRIAQRSIGYERVNSSGQTQGAGLEQAYNQYLEGREGQRLKQKIAKGQWKPITDYNEIEPQDGADVVSTIDVNIQDVAHHALLEQLQKYKADHGCVVVMDVKTGEVKAISNLGMSTEGNYYERLNYAIGETYEPGSTFKVASMMAALEDKVIDTGYVVDTKQGQITFYNRYHVRDAHHGGFGKISASEVIRFSSNVGIVEIIDKFYGDNPKKFVNRLYNIGLDNKLGLSIKGEGNPFIPYPTDKNWSGISLQWMAYGYGVELTPLQMLTFYNAIANNGEMVKPRLIKEIKSWDGSIEKFDKEVINPSIASQETLHEIRAMLKSVVENKHGTAHALYTPDFPMAGKTGTSQKDYGKGSTKLNYISSFAGYFPANHPKYSCIVVIHNPDKSKGFYGADVAGPVFKSVAQKIYTNSPVIDTIENLHEADKPSAKAYQQYYAQAQQKRTTVPDVKGMSGMDAISLLENLGLKVRIEGDGKVKSQSLRVGEKIEKNQTIVLQLS